MVKIDTRSIGRVLTSPDAWRLVLLHGEDAGLIREYAAELTRNAAGSLDDPFRVALLAREDHDRLAEEATALSLDGGRRVIWIREAPDSLATQLGKILDGPGSALLIVEASALPARGKLRKLAETAEGCASIGCYPEEGRSLENSVRRMLEERQVSITGEALGWLTAHLGSDRAAVRNEVEKLSLYAGPGHQLSLEDVQICTGDSGTASVDDAIFMAMAGDRSGMDLALERALAEGASPIAVARVLLSQINRLRRVKLDMQTGKSRADAIKALRPPLFFRKQASFERAVELWSLDLLSDAAHQTQAFELACKQTGAMDALLCRRHLSALASKAGSLARHR